MADVLDFRARDVSPTLQRFALSDAFVRFVKGPVGSGKSTKCVKELGRRAMRQRPGPDGVRRTRWAVIRNTYSQLRDTTRKTFEQWIPPQLGSWHEQAFTFTLRADDVEAEILFRALDRPEDVKKLLSLELTGAYVNEVREIPKHVLDILETRVGRYPARRDGGPTWFGIWADSNPWHGGHWASKLFAKQLPGYELFCQPGGRAENAENVENLPPGYYERLCLGKDSSWISVYVDGEDADSDTGAIWGAWVAELERRGGVCAFDHDQDGTTDGVFTFWDLGRRDATGIWFWRYNPRRGVDVIDHYEACGEGLSHFLGVVDAKPYRYRKHWFPHDAEQKTLATQQSVIEQAASHWGGEYVALGPKLSLADGIAAGRWLLEQPDLRIHERCTVPGRLEHSGVDAIREYRYEWDDEAQCFSSQPLHNWASHSADAFRGMATVVRFVERLTRPAASPNTAPRPVNLEALWQDNETETRGRV